MHFLQFTGKDAGNKLERDLHAKLLDEAEITRLIADGLMYYHVYADLVMLSKANDLGKSSLDMNQHYFELKLYLQEVEHHPEIVMDKDCKVFRSEENLYGDNKSINHRKRSKVQAVHAKLFSLSECYSATLYPLLISGAVKMRSKLCTYAQNQLPGGKYWDPEPDVKKVLAELKPSNDLCESIFGLNDYLTTTIPNLHPMARSNLVEVKKNKSVKWLHDLPEQQQLKVIDLAVDKRQSVQSEYRDEEERRITERRQNMAQTNVRREALKRKVQQERDELSQLHLITTSEELHQVLADVDCESFSAAKKRAQTLSILRTQIKIRKKVLGQNIHITFTRSRRQRPIHEIVRELSDYIERNSSKCSGYIQHPNALIGRQISHKFKIGDAGEVKWYHGTVLNFDAATGNHEIIYDGEEEHCHFDLTVDLLSGDLKVLS